MKKIMIGGAAIIMIGLFASIIWYQLSFKNMQPQLGEKLPKPPTGKQDPGVEELRPVVANQQISYTLQNNELNITFDSGKTWVTVPVEKKLLFGGEYNGNQHELIPNSFILTDDKAAFIHTEGGNWESEGVMLVYSNDLGETWQHSVVTELFQGVRFRKVNFLNENFGYIILSGGRTMSQEGSSVFLSDDGGKTWNETESSGQTRLLYDGGFIDEKTGFLSYGTINPTEPDFHVTQDDGASWQKADVHVPAKYKEIFVSAEIPVKDGYELVMLVNQGPNGDYLGGRVKGKFISNDNGLTWEFAEEAEPDE
ncbi:oxidoreductase [Bacillus sp. FJAT-27225]|uniref:WD40/YVTN/BNR-like repeat-containing protein n=1 Tax=Bacillus sp. FJAT-27225 TaxID=1743144 RepID=UPI00080C21C1|nr:sialidase family protein [Bacillus sp. FJAT-27225]OCA90527.1 oxidoreductase [Bacillus sp. FJAT-27225]